MAIKPIIFSAAMVRSLLDGRKTQTRRVLKPQPGEGFAFLGIYAPGLTAVFSDGDPNNDLTYRLHSRGDFLYVRETWNSFAFSQDGEEAWPTDTIPTAEEMAEIRELGYRVSIHAVYKESQRAREFFNDQPWRTPLHMPRWASRLTLEVTDVRVERVQDISEGDALAEGMTFPAGMQYGVCPKSAFAGLWNSINAKRGYGWDTNPWVTAISFKVHHKNIDALLSEKEAA